MSSENPCNKSFKIKKILTVCKRKYILKKYKLFILKFIVDLWKILKGEMLSHEQLTLVRCMLIKHCTYFPES